MQVFESSEQARSDALAKVNLRGLVTPDIPHAPQYGNQNGGVAVDPGQIAGVLACAAEGYHFGVVEHIVSAVVDCGFSVTLRYGSEVLLLTNSDAQIIDRYWSDIARDALRMLLTVGMCAVSVDKNGSTAPHLIPFQHIVVKFVSSAKTPHKFWVEDKIDNSVIDCLLFVSNLPQPNGSLTSRGYSLLASSIHMAHLVDDEDGANFVRARPVIAFEHTTAGYARQDPTATDSSRPGQVDDKHRDVYEHVTQREESAAEAAIRTARTAHGDFVSQIAAATPAKARAAGTVSPFDNILRVPMNFKVASTAMAQTNPNYQFECGQHEGLVRMAYGISQETLDPKHGQKLAATSDKNEKNWAKSVETRQRMIGNLLAECFRRLNADWISKFATEKAGDTIDKKKEIVTRIVEENRKLREMEQQQAINNGFVYNPDAGAPFNRLSELPKSYADAQRRMKKRTARDAEIIRGEIKPPGDADSTDGESSSDDNSSSASAMGSAAATERFQIITNDAGEKQLKDTVQSMERLLATIVANGDTDPDVITTKIRVTVTFKNLANTSIEQLLELFKAGVIGRFELARQIAKITNIDPELLIDTIEKALDEADMIRRITEMATPEPPEPSGGAAPAKKPTKASKTTGTPAPKQSRKK